MGGATEFCRHPGDPEGCMASLIESFRSGALGQHCTMIGLQHKHPQCLQVLTRGLRGSDVGCNGPGARATAAHLAPPAGQLPPPTAASQAALHLAWQKGIRAASDLFFNFYKGLVGSALNRWNLSKEEVEVVFQDVFLAMAVRMKNPKPFRGKFSAYLWQVIRSQVAKLLKTKREWEQQGAELKAEGPPAGEAPNGKGTVDIPTKLVEWWEDLDSFLRNHPDGKFEHRMLLAQAFICTEEFDKRSSTESILTSWQDLAKTDEATLSPIACEAAVRQTLSPDVTIAWIAGDMLREGSAQVWSLPVILGQDAGMTIAQVLELARDLANGTVGDVDTLVFRMKHLLAEHIRRDLWDSGEE